MSQDSSKPSVCFWHYQDFYARCMPHPVKQVEVGKIYVLEQEEYQFFQNNLSLLESYHFLKKDKTLAKFSAETKSGCLLVATHDFSEGLFVSQEYIAEVDDVQQLDLKGIPEETASLELQMNTEQPIPIPAAETRIACFTEQAETAGELEQHQYESPFIISKLVFLNEQDFGYYKEHLHNGDCFEQKNRWYMDNYGDDSYISILVTSPAAKDGILVCDGYRAYLPDCTKYETAGLSRECWQLDKKQPMNIPVPKKQVQER